MDILEIEKTEDSRTFFSRIKDIYVGFKKPKDSKEYKIAKIELQRLWAPISAITLPCLLILCLMLFANNKKQITNEFITEIIQTEEVPEQLEEIEPIQEPQEFENVDVVIEDNFFTPEIAIDTPAPVQADGPVSAQPQSIDAVVQIKSPVILRGIFGDLRNAGMRGTMIGRYGGNEKTENAVIRSLRWLKSVQNSDGSWPNNKVAMTGLAILTFLAHGEKPGSSPEFGETVQKALEFLITSQNENGLYTTSGNGYAHAIATYAMCEAYGMTMNPNVKESANRALEIIIKGQHPNGGWDYNWKQTERDDTSVMGWAAQALKAGIMANVYDNPDEIERASKMCVKGFKHNGFVDGGFGYTSPAKGGLTGVGTLCLQFHHAENDSYVKNSLENIILKWKPEWVGYTPLLAKSGVKVEQPKDLPPGVVGGACPQYYYYYATQAVFQNGGKPWESWNQRMWPSYVSAQFIVPAGENGTICDCPLCKTQFKNKLSEPYQDDKGKYQEIGHWINTDVHTDRPIMDTCLAALQMMVYYRYLPTFQKIDIPAEVMVNNVLDSDIEVDSNL